MTTTKQQMEITPEQALQILSEALQPQMLGVNPQITRSGFVAIEKSILILAEVIKNQSN